MKTQIKILLLILFSIGAIAGVLVFAKTRVAPPSKISIFDQYSANLKSSYESYDSIKDFDQSRKEYIRLDDKLNRFVSENAIEPVTSDEYRKKINETYGKALISYGFGLLQKPVWTEDGLNELLSMLSSLKSDKLSDGKTAVTTDFVQAAKRLNDIINEYHAAIRLSRNTSFNGINDASEKIRKAEGYCNTEYLRNNTSLVNALHALKGHLAQSHYNHVSNIVNTLGGYSNISKDYYKNTLIPRAENAITEYKKTNIYGSTKRDIADVENRGANLVTAAMNYYADDDN